MARKQKVETEQEQPAVVSEQAQPEVKAEQDPEVERLKLLLFEIAVQFTQLRNQGAWDRARNFQPNLAVEFEMLMDQARREGR